MGAQVTATAAATEHDDSTWPDRRYAWYVVVVLLLTYTNSYLDRQVLSLLIEPMRRDLGFNDTQVSLLAGLAFAVFYAVAGIPLAWLADSWNRRRLILLGSITWSVMTALCAIAHNFAQLFGCRIGVGVGEASLSPATFSLLADYFPKDRLATPIAVFSMAVYVGAGLAMIIGGAVVRITAEQAPLLLPVVGSLPAWKLTFVYVAALGIPTTLLLLTLREPIRRGYASPSNGGVSIAARASLQDFFRRNRNFALCHFTGFGLYALAVAAFLFWTPTLFIRTYGWTPSQIGGAFGAILLVLGTAGVFTGGWLTDRLFAKGWPDASLRLGMFTALASIPLAGFVCLAPDGRLALAGLGLTVFVISIQGGLPPVSLQLVTPNALRARVSAIYFLVMSLLGVGCGPTAVGLTTDYVFGHPEDLRFALAIVAGGTLAVAALVLLLSLKPFARILAELDPTPATAAR